jgi:hypothetical protein
MAMRIKHPTQCFRRRKQFDFQLLCSMLYTQWKWTKFKCIWQFEEFKCILLMFRDGLCLLHGTKLNFIHNSGGLDTVTKATNAHKCIKVWYTKNIVSLLHVSAPLVVISREMHYKRWTYQEITYVCETTHRCKIPSFINTWFKIHT